MLRGSDANPRNLIRLTPAEGLDASIAKRPIPTAMMMKEEGAMRPQITSMFLRGLAVATLGLGFSTAAVAQEKTLTVYTYESFVSEWGPGPKVKEAFESTCDCTVNFVGVADGVSGGVVVGVFVGVADGVAVGVAE